MYFVYILRGPKDHLYTGVTSGIEDRLLKHKSGSGAESTKRNKTFSIVRIEEYKTLKEARKREKQIKGWNRKKKENLIKFGRPYE